MRAIVVCGITLFLAFPSIAAERESREIQWRSGPMTLSVGTAALDTAAKAGDRHVVVQFSGPLSADEQKAVEAAGVRLQAYLGADAYFASIRAGKADTIGLRAVPSLAAVEAIRPEWKLHPALLSGDVPEYSVVKSSREAKVAAVYVLFHSDVDLTKEGVPLLEQLGGKVRDTMSLVNGAVVELPVQRIADLAGDDRVQWVEPPLPPLTGTNLENRGRIEASLAQAAPYNLTGQGVDVLVYDAGLARETHQGFGGRLHVRDWFPGDTRHATHVAGTIGGNGAGSASNQQKGMAPNVTMESYAYFGGGLYSDPGDLQADYTEAIQTFGVDLANNSIGSNVELNGLACSIQGDYTVTDQLIDSIVRGGLGAPFRVVWANGNERQASRCDTEGFGDYYSIAPPAGAKNHITVGALNSNDDSMTWFSSWGPTDDGRMKPDVAAPGDQIGGDGGVTSTGDASDSEYYVNRGTSMAAPTVTGAVALLLEDYRVRFPGTDPRNSTLKVLLAQTAVDLGNAGPDYQTGYGSVRIKQAIDLMRGTARFLESDVSQGSVRTYAVSVASGTSQLKATVAWDDYPGTPNVFQVLVNDLDVIIRAPNGTVYYPWTLNPNSPSAAAVRTTKNFRDNIEQVRVDNPAAGMWSIEVSGIYVPQGPQTFSITASAALCPTVPPTLSAPSNGATGVPVTPLLDWDDVSGAASYDVQVATSAAFTTIAASASVSTSSWNVTPALSAGSTYYWRVRTVQSCGGSSPWSATRSFSTCSATAAPTLLVPSDGAVLTTVTSPTLDWTDVSGTTYEVQVSTSSTFVPVTRSASNLAASTWNVSPALPTATRYYWRARAVNTCAPSPWSATRSFDLGCVPVNAVYDSGRRAPTCTASACGCTTGTLVNSRDSIAGGGEPNQPNTINNSCGDGTAGSYHSFTNGDSVDRVVVRATDGLRLRPGGTASIEVTVWCQGNGGLQAIDSPVPFDLTDGSLRSRSLAPAPVAPPAPLAPPLPTDRIDLYYSSNAASPSWTPIATSINCGPEGGLRTFTQSFTLANVTGPHAVRAQIRFGGSAGTCVSGSTHDRDDVVFQVAGVPQQVVSVEAGYAHTVWLKNYSQTIHSVWTVGLNDHGQLGNGSTVSSNYPYELQSISNAVAVAAGTAHTVVLLSDGTLRAWGKNAEGQLGDGSTTERTLPITVPGVTGVAAIAAGAEYTLALKTDGTVLAWGDNTFGQLGDGTTLDRLSPTPVSGLSNAVAVSAGFHHSVAVKGDGTVWTWGYNGTGVLGDGTHTDRSLPGVVPGLTGVRRVAAGAYFNVAQLQDGTLKAWGHNYYGQLGDGSNAERAVPVAIPGMTDITIVAPGSGFTLVSRVDSTVWSTGQNVEGQLGNGTLTSRNTFGSVLNMSPPIWALAAGEDHSLAMRYDAILYGWGKNLNGQIGGNQNPTLIPSVFWAPVVGVP
jgi:alpha-tubulin suppressor-like RCC1 family protein